MPETAGRTAAEVSRYLNMSHAGLHWDFIDFQQPPGCAAEQHGRGGSRWGGGGHHEPPHGALALAGEGGAQQEAARLLDLSTLDR